MILSFVAGARAQNNYFPLLYTHTIYTDNLQMPGGWWANPALPALLTAPFIHTANVLPLGDSMLISSFRLFFPVANKVIVGADILGAGLYNAGTSSTNINENGASYRSSFAFARPRFDIGAAATAPFVGSVGIMGTFGTELQSTGSGTANTVSPGFGFGWLSPAVAHTVNLSMAAMFIFHNLDVPFWEKNGKLGLRMFAFDSLVAGSAEYTVTFGDGFGVFKTPSWSYEALKAVVSVRIYQHVAIMTGFSTDIDKTGINFNNGPLAHVGVELRSSPDFPFAGGYDIGFRFGQNWVLLHRFWLGCNFKILRQTLQQDGQ